MSKLKSYFSKGIFVSLIRQVSVYKSLLFFFLFVAFFDAFSGIDVEVRGQVKGLVSSDRQTVPVVLSNVSVSIVLEGQIAFDLTNLAGVYIVNLKKDKRYLMTVSREGYHAKSVWINTHNLPIQKSNDKVELTDLDFLLLKKEAFPDDISSMEDMGQLVYNTDKGEFTLNVNRDWRKAKEGRDNSIRLMHKTITYIEGKRYGGVNEQKKEADNLEKKKNNLKPDVEILEDEKDKDIVVEEKQLENKISFKSGEYKSLEEIRNRKLMLDSAKADLEVLRKNAQTKEDSLIVTKLEAQILAAEIDLKLAEETILNQQTRIAMQQRLITIYIVCSVLLLLIVGVIIWFYREKVKMNHLLQEKNQLILDGITYANTIQKSFLKSTEDIRAILPDFVLFFRPRDIVSGDIYWVSRVDNNLIVAAIDCTGHGVPGAFISMIANTLLNEIVNNKKQFDPGTILSELHLGVMEVLQQDAGGSQSQDGMDMSLVVINTANKEMKFAGARNHMIRVQGQEVETIKADINSIGGRSLRSSDGFNKTFNTKEITLDQSASYYLFSDGFIDQFGGPENRKFNLPNFYDLLKLCSSLNKEEQEKKFASVFDDWKGSNEQLDDVLVLGFEI